MRDSLVKSTKVLPPFLSYLLLLWKLMCFFIPAKFRRTAVAVKKITRSKFREKSDLDLFQKEILIMRYTSHSFRFSCFHFYHFTL